MTSAKTSTSKTTSDSASQAGPQAGPQGGAETSPAAAMEQSIQRTMDAWSTLNPFMAMAKAMTAFAPQADKPANDPNGEQARTGEGEQRDLVDMNRDAMRRAFPWLGLFASKAKEAHERAQNGLGGADEYGATLDGVNSLDRMSHALMGRATIGLSPSSLSLACADWALHMAAAPGKQAQMLQKTMRKGIRLGLWNLRAMADPTTPPVIEPLPGDRRFSSERWQRWPFSLIYQGFLMNQQLAHNATHGVRGVSKHSENVVNFMARQVLDVVSPSNFLATNPDLMEATLREGGQNFVRGSVHMVEDWERSVAGRPPVGSHRIQVGRDVALSEGEVIYRNDLMELIQYKPTTDKVQAEPILVVPAWIMKYYILDLSPHNSMVQYLLSQGHTVFMISWKNPGAEDRDKDMESYRTLGFETALEAVHAVVPDQPVNVVGYCLGGTLTAICSAVLARRKDKRLNTITLFAAQVDFREAGELTLFIDESQLTYLEDMMWDQGYLDTSQMAGAFQMLRSNDLIWSRNLSTYLMGERQPMNDLMAWNADATRLPYKMHSDYLRRMFLNNDLVEGRYEVDGRPVALTDIRAPIFAVGTETDHVAPWRSVYKIHLTTDSDVTFCLTKGGHNAGIVSEPGHPRRHYRLNTRKADDRYIDPDTWVRTAPVHEGSWWPAWSEWLKAHSKGQVPAPALGAPDKGYPPIYPAPGKYVFQR